MVSIFDYIFFYDTNINAAPVLTFSCDVANTFTNSFDH